MPVPVHEPEGPAAEGTNNHIVVSGAREHNLKNITRQHSPGKGCGYNRLERVRQINPCL